MRYTAGIDVGTTFCAAGTWRDGQAATVALGDRAPTVPSVLFLREDGVLLVGDAAVRRAVSDPRRVVREFKRRVGDTVPLVLGGRPFGAADLTARVVRWVADRVSEREGGPPAYAVLTHPASWGAHRRAVMAEAAAAAGLPAAGLLPEPVAAGLYYASQQRVPAGSLIAVYDLGGGTFDATVLRKTAASFEVVGTPRGDDQLGGVDVDQAVFDHVVRAVGAEWPEIADEDQVGMAALAQVRAAVVDAKEALSADTEAVVPVLLPGYSREVRITRSELERTIEPLVLRTIDLVRQTCTSAGVTPQDLDSVLLVGGASRMPLVARMVTRELGRPVAVDAHPKYAVCLGAAIAAAARIGAVLPEPVAPPPPPPGPAAVPPAPALAIAADLEQSALTAPSDQRLPRAGRPAPARDLVLTHRDDRLVVRIGGEGADPTLEQREQRSVVVMAVAAVVLVAALIAGLAFVTRPEGGGADEPGAGQDPLPGGAAAAAAGAEESGGTMRLAGGPLAGQPEAGAMLGAAALGDGHLVAVGRRADPAGDPNAPSAGGEGSAGIPAAWRSDDGGATWAPIWIAPGGGAGEIDGVTAGPDGGLVAVGWVTTAGPDAAGSPDSPGTSTGGPATRAAVWRAPGDDPSAWEEAAPTGLDGAVSLGDVTRDPGGELIAVGRDVTADAEDGDGGVWRSADGVAWQRVDAPGLGGPGRQELHRLARLADGRWVAIGRQLRGAALVPAIWTSPDLATWTDAGGRPASVEGVPSLWGLAVLPDGTLVTAGSRPGIPGDPAGAEAALWLAAPDTLNHWQRLDPPDGSEAPNDQQVRALLTGLPALVAVGSDSNQPATWTVDISR